MKALVAQELCGPAGLVYTDVADPAPASDSVLVDVRAAGVCCPDLLLIGGQYQLRVDPPFIPGTEVVGVVQAAPPGSGFATGDRVIDPVGGEPFDEAVRALAVEGRLLVLGFAGGSNPSVNVNRLLLRNAGVLGVGWREYLMANPGAQQEYGRGVAHLVAAGLRPPAPQNFRWPGAALHWRLWQPARYTARPPWFRSR